MRRRRRTGAAALITKGHQGSVELLLGLDAQISFRFTALSSNKLSLQTFPMQLELLESRSLTLEQHCLLETFLTKFKHGEFISTAF